MGTPRQRGSVRISCCPSPLVTALLPLCPGTHPGAATPCALSSSTRSISPWLWLLVEVTVTVWVLCSAMGCEGWAGLCVGSACQWGLQVLLLGAPALSALGEDGRAQLHQHPPCTTGRGHSCHPLPCPGSLCPSGVRALPCPHCSPCLWQCPRCLGRGEGTLWCPAPSALPLLFLSLQHWNSNLMLMQRGLQ